MCFCISVVALYNAPCSVQCALALQTDVLVLSVQSNSPLLLSAVGGCWTRREENAEAGNVTPETFQ